MSPEEIADRQFLVSIRGYDRDEVHAFLTEVAETVEGLQQRRDELERAVAAATTQAAADAHDAADAPPDFGAVGEETKRVLEAAAHAGEEIRRKARQEADRELQAARRDAARVIAEAERRRERIESAIATLEERRNALSGELRNVASSVDRIIESLAGDDEAPSVRQALAAAAAKAHRAGEAGGAEPLRRGAQEATSTGSSSGDSAPAATSVPRARAEPGPQPEPEPHRGAPPVDGAGDAAPAPPKQPEVAQPGSGGDAPAPADADPVEAAQEDAETVAAATAGVAPERRAEAEPAADDDPSPAEEAGPAADGPARAEEAEEPVAADGPAPAEEPELAADGPAPLEEAELAADGPAPAEEAEEPVAAGEPAPAEEPVAEQETPTSLRAGALEPLHPKMVRRLKRGLSDVQNLVLDRLRRATPRTTIEELTPSDEELAQLGELVGLYLDDAYLGGVSAAGVLAGRRLPTPELERTLTVGFVADCGHRVRDPLVATLRMGLSADEALPSLNDRVGAVFAELKGTAADELSATHLIRAYELGLLDTWQAGGVSHRRWLLGREPRCPEGRCRQNDHSGEVAVTEPFPSGHDVPPVHVGCTCTTIPVPES